MRSNNSFTVSTDTRSGVLRCDGTELLTFSVSRPVFTADFEACCLPPMNRSSQQTASNFERYARTCMYRDARCDFIQNSTTDIPFHTYEAVQNYEIPYNQDCHLSVYVDQYQFSGGAHGITPRSSQNWCAGLRRTLTLRDFFPHKPHLEQYIQCEIIRQIGVQMESGEKEYFDNYAELVAQTFNPCSFYMVPGGLAVYFQQYDIAPYVMGIPVFIIPYGGCAAPFPCS